MSVEHYHGLCQKYRGRAVEIRTHNGRIHRGIIQHVDNNRVYLQPLGGPRNLGGLGYGGFGGIGGYGYGLGGFGGGFGAPWCPRPVVAPVAAPSGNGFALIVVLFILLIIIGASACA
jgi:uncharacterized protein (TIGR01732 family)